MRQDANRQLYRPTWVEVNLSCFEYNLNQIRKIVNNQAKILAVLKADAYGHGAIKVAKKFKECAVEYFGVATVLEAIELRENKINTPILLLAVSTPKEFNALVRYNIIPTIADLKTAISLNKTLDRLGKRMPIHIKIDTGMGRIGVWHEEAVRFIRSLSKLKNLLLQGIFTHFPNADTDREFTKLQIASFKKLTNTLEENDIHIPLRHTANSAAIMNYKDSYFNLVRPGLMLYGLYQDTKQNRSIKLKPALSFKTKITYLKHVPPDRSISYGRTFITKTKAKIATLPVGYADGYNRLLSNKAEVLVRGKRCLVVGRICMDQTMIDVTGINAKLGDEVVLIGSQNKTQITAEEISGFCYTISYEVVCWISRRVPSLYVD